jgi:nitroreductase
MGGVSDLHPSIALIRERTSVRTFTPDPLPEGTLEWLKDQCASAGPGPFGSRPRIVVTESPDGAGGGERLGTYGMISGARGFIVCIIQRDQRLEDTGFVLEGLVLLAAARGLGTCWLGGTFDRGRFARHVGAASSEIIPAVTPFGIPAARRRFVERVVRAGARAANRKPWEDLFFDGEPGRPLSEKAAGHYAAALECVRFAPSASNRQPWRVVSTPQGFLFLLSRTPGYGSSLGYDIQGMDMGIAMRHFDVAVREMGLTGRWVPEREARSERGMARIALWQRDSS